MQNSSQPKLLPIPFATGGSKQDIPNDSQIGITAGRASYTDGFPPLTRTPLAAGGIPPFGTDFNGVFNDITAAIRWSQAGAGYSFNTDFSSAVAGYPKGARIPNSSLDGFWLNTVDGNNTNPENTTSSLTGWVPQSCYGVTNITGLSGSSVVLTTLQASKDRLIFSGTLSANINVVVPAWIKKWEVVNNTTGAYSITLKTPSGSGVAVPSGSNAILQGDGTNITQGVAPGSLLGKKILTSSGVYSPSIGTKSIIVEAIGGGGAGGGSVATTSGQQSSGSGGASGGYVMATFTSGFAGASYIIGSGGSAANGNNGGNGSSTTFLTINAGGGSGGPVGTASVASVIAGSFGGSATGGDINAAGSNGNSGIVYTASVALGGFGGSSKIYPGNGGASRASTGDGFPATGYGCGGGGGNSGASGGTRAGGIGAQGLIIIWEYA